MSTLTATRTATLPRVNLLPPEIEQERRFRRVQLGLGAGVLASIGVVAALFLAANGQVSEAGNELSDSKRETVRLESRTAEYSQVPLIYSQVEAAQAQLELAMGKEVRWSFFLNDLSLKTPNKVWLTEMTVTQTDNAQAAAVAASAAASGTYLSAGLGTVQFKGNAMSHNNVAAWLDSLAKQKGYAQPYFTDSTREEIGDVNVVRFDSKVSITEDALSKRYVQKAGS
jgi:Tfp pilus assembly protein PilN